MGADQSSNRENHHNRTQYANERRRQAEINTSSAMIYERQRNPYSYAQTDLQNDVGRRNEPLYPNLQTNNNSSDMYGDHARTRTTQNTSGFVYVRQKEVPTYSTQRSTAPSYPTNPSSAPTYPTGQSTAPTYPTVQRTAPPRPTPPRSFTPPTAVPRANTPVQLAAPVTPSAPASSAPSYSRSASRDRRKGDNVYNCPTCDNRYGMDIFGCPNGHSSCKDCRIRGANCGICGLNITDMRNYAMQDFMAQIKVACPNASDGCTLQLKTKDIELHASECPFAEMDCPVNTHYGNCRWRGKSSHMLAHFNDVHPGERQGDVDTELVLPNICSDSHSLYLVPMSPYYFLFHVKVDSMRRCIYMTTQLLGTGMSAAKWNYEVHVYNKREPRRKYMYVAPCTTATIPVTDIFNKAECATIPLPYALTFINEGILTYKFFIKKINDYTKFTDNDKHDNTQRANHNRSNFRGNGRGRGRGFHHKTNNN